MTYDDIKDLEGSKVDIVEGRLVLSDEGFLTVSRSLLPYTVYLNDFQKSVLPIVPKSEYRGHPYKLRKQDCVTLYGKWHDECFGTSLLNVYTEASNEKFFAYYKGDFRNWFRDNGFESVSDMQYGDCIFYAYNDVTTNKHISAYLGNGKILHHLPMLYSCVDVIKESRIVEVFRYAN